MHSESKSLPPGYTGGCGRTTNQLCRGVDDGRKRFTIGLWAVHLGADTTWASPCTTLCVKANVCVLGSPLFGSGDDPLVPHCA
jgi:hypothetical protein